MADGLPSLSKVPVTPVSAVTIRYVLVPKESKPVTGAKPTEPPRLIGNDTRSAMEAGVFWLTAAGIDGLLTKLQGELPATAEIFVTGGKMASTHRQLSHDVRHIPFLVLSGLAMVHR